MSESGSVGIVETQYFTLAEPPNEMPLDNGGTLGPITLAYETYGTLNEDASNAVLIQHALSGDAHVAGRHSPQDKKPGWWDRMVGPGKPFDTEKYFIICSNVIGGCQGSTGPASINPKTGKPYGLSFPVITIADMVRAQRYLVEHLGITKLLSVAGGSMGGMQALVWATAYPDSVASAMVIASTHVSGAQQIAFDAVGRGAIQADRNFNNGAYYDGAQPDQGLAIARMLAHITYLSDEAMGAKFGRKLRKDERLRFDFSSEFSVETYLEYQGEQFVNRFDANTYLYITKALDYFDLGTKYGSLEAAMALTKCRFLVLSFSSDWLYPPYQSQEITYALARCRHDVTYCNVKSSAGHDAFLLETEVQGKIVSGFLHHALHPQEIHTQSLQTDSETDSGPPAASKSSIYDGHRVDYDAIVDLVEPGSRVLDIGCGDGELLCRLIRQREVRGVGMELSQGNIVTCARRGIPVIQADIDKGMAEFPDGSFDYVILSMTLQVLSKPDFALREMLRIGRKCIVSFPNFAYWRPRLKSFVSGRAPVSRNLPYSWYESPNRHVLTIKDFRDFCANQGFNILRECPLSSSGEARFLPNLRAQEALYLLGERA